MAIPVGVGIPMFLKFKIGRRRKRFVNQLGDTPQLMAGSLTAGYGLGQPLDPVARATDAPPREQFPRLVRETRLGRSREVALKALAYTNRATKFDERVAANKNKAKKGNAAGGETKGPD